ncbi:MULTISPECIES: anti-sigma factor domain-containing protein [unclassified Streptomyces]|uniref:anti-sigma factor n=1 Tax=unclassified Streptomyces TaxID=2593676 RepID=UPI0036E26B65
MTTADLHTLTGAYAVHALPDGEREEFERHIADCSACAQEVRELSATATRLALAASVVPPPHMREQVLRRVAAVRQEPPVVTRQERRGLAGWVAGARRLPRYALAACMAGVVGLGGVAVWQHQAADDARQRANQAEQRAGELSQVLSAPDAASTTRKLSTGTTATVVVSRSLGKAAFLAAGMPTPAAGKTYELWFDDGGKMRPAGLMDPSATDQAVVLDGRIDNASGVGVTVEPAGGSQQPTSAPLALVTFPAAARA